MADYDQACMKAQRASERANASGEAAHHDKAAKAQRKAAAAAFSSGKPDLGKQHSKKAAQHSAQGSPKSSVNPLQAWMKAQTAKK